MNMEFPKERSPDTVRGVPTPDQEKPQGTAQDSAATASDEQAMACLDDEVTQAAYRKAYLEQLRRQACPGCGESEIF